MKVNLKAMSRFNGGIVAHHNTTYYTRMFVAKYLGVSKVTVRKWQERNLLPPGVKISDETTELWAWNMEEVKWIKHYLPKLQNNGRYKRNKNPVRNSLQRKFPNLTPVRIYINGSGGMGGGSGVTAGNPGTSNII